MNSFNKFIEKWMALVTPLCLIAGVIFSNQLCYVLFLVPYVFAFMTFSGSLGLNFNDLKLVFQHPLGLIISLLILHFIVPFLAYKAGTLFFPENPYIITGMVLEFILPTAVISTMWVSIYHGSLPFTFSMLLVDTIFTPFLIPVSLHYFIGSNVKVNAYKIMIGLLLMVALPAFLAMTLNHCTRGKAEQILSPKLAPYGKIALIIVVSINSSKVAPFLKNMTPMLFEVIFVMLTIAIIGYILGWVFALFFRQKKDMIISMTLNCGLRNISAGAVIAATYFPSEVMFPVMIGTLFQQILASIFAKLLEKSYNTEN